MIWQLREGFFKGAKTYTIGREGGQSIKVAVDDNGCFQLATMPSFPIGVFAKFVSSDKDWRPVYSKQWSIRTYLRCMLRPRSDHR